MLFKNKILLDILEHSYIRDTWGGLRTLIWSLPIPHDWLFWLEVNIINWWLIHCPARALTKSIILIVFVYMFFFFLTKYSFRTKRLGIININELLSEWFEKQISIQVPFDKSKFFLFFYLLFIFLFFCNFGGLIPFCETVTVFLYVCLFFSLTIQLGLSLITLHLYRFNAIKMFVPKGVPFAVCILLFVVEIVSYLSRIISLAVRLFANMFAGHCVLIILSIIILGTIEALFFSSVLYVVLAVIITVLIILLKIAVSFLQAYVFLSLVAIYINSNLALH